MKRISFNGVIIGTITDIAAINILAILFIMTGRYLVSIPDEQLFQALENDRWMFYAQLFINSSCTILGGYVAASIAKHDEVLNGALTAFLGVIGGIYALLLSIPENLFWHFVVTPAFAALGGYLRLKTKRRESHA